MSKFAVFAPILVVVLCACAGGQAINNAEPAAAEEQASMRTEEELQRRLEVRQRAVKQFPELPEQEGTNHIVGEVPDAMLDAVKKDLAERLGASYDDLKVIKAAIITWNDGSLGCPKPGQDYTQALVPGYWIILVRDSEEYDYRATERGYFILCDLPRMLKPRSETQ